jgi:hypothetical protein
LTMELWMHKSYFKHFMAPEVGLATRSVHLEVTSKFAKS